MARDGAVTLDWGDGEYHFRLAWGELASLQEACDAGPYVILERLQNNTWRLNDIREVIRFGLIGGGTKPPEALRLVRAYVEARPPLENRITATAILTVGLMGAPEEDVGESSAADQANHSPASPTGSSDSRPSTEAAVH